MTAKPSAAQFPFLLGNEADLFPGIREWNMIEIPGRPGNGSLGMDSLRTCTLVLQ